MQYRLRTLLIVLALAPPALAYFGSYVVLSRRGYALTDSVGGKGFWFVLPETKRDEKKNEGYIRLFWPLIEAELLIGTGRTPVSGICCGPELPP
jgi:hypothetical protein